MTEESNGITRRQLMAGAGAAGVGIGLGGAGYLVGRETAEGSSHLDETVPFYATRQAGIETPAQDRLHFASFDLTVETADELRDLLREWSDAAAEMTEGKMVGDENNELLAPPDDTGETVGLQPASLTVTFGLGPDVFEQDGRDRFGLRSKRPHALRQIDPLPADLLDPDALRWRHLRPGVLERSAGRLPRRPQPGQAGPGRGGHALVPARLRPYVEHHPQPGDAAQPDGVQGRHRNLRAEDTEAMQRFVWLGEGDDVPWMTDGTYIVTRRIRMLIEIWDRSPLLDQEDTIGRQKYYGAPLGEQGGVRPARPRRPAERASS